MEQNKNIIKMLEMSFRFIVTQFIKHPENLEVSSFNDGGKIIIKARAHYADQGKIIGKDKANLMAVRSIMDCVASRLGVSVKVDNILPASVGAQESPQPFSPVKLWSEDATRADLKKTLDFFLQRPFEIESKPDNAEFKTTFNLKISTLEKLPISVGQAAYALSKIFHATGRMRGRLIYVTGTETKI